MIFNKKAPEWKNAGVEPPGDLKERGFQAGYKPPAAYFNWFFHQVSESLKELQGSFFEITEPEIDAIDHISGDPIEPGEVAGEPITSEDIDEIIKK